MDPHHQLPCPTVVLTAETHRSSAVRDLTDAIGPALPRCPGKSTWSAWPLVLSGQAQRARPKTKTWMIAAHWDCHACPVHPLNEYATWLTYYTQHRLEDVPPWEYSICGPVALGIGVTPRPRRTWPGGPEGHPHFTHLLDELVTTSRTGWWDAYQQRLPETGRALQRQGHFLKD